MNQDNKRGALLRDNAGEIICVCPYKVISFGEDGYDYATSFCEVEEAPPSRVDPTLVECIREIIQTDPEFASLRDMISVIYNGIF